MEMKENLPLLNVLSPFPGDLEKLLGVHENRANEVDRQMVNSEKKYQDVQMEISEIEIQIGAVWQERREAALGVQMNKVVWKANTLKEQELKNAVTRLSNQISDECCRLQDLDFLIDHERAQLEILDEEARVTSMMVKHEVDNSSVGIQLKQAKLNLNEAKLRLQETEKEVGSIEQLNRDVLEIEEKKSVLTDKSNQLTKILMNSKAMHQSAIDNLTHLDKEIKILSKKKDALKIRLLRRIEETEERLAAKKCSVERTE